MRHIPLIASAVLALAACDGFGGPKERPEAFALTAVRALTMNDWGAYLPLCSHTANRAAAGAAGSLGQRLAPMELDAKRAQFDAVVRSRRLRVHAVDVYQTVVTATENDRWTLEVQDANGNPIGVQLVVARVGQHYELVIVSLI